MRVRGGTATSHPNEQIPHHALVYFRPYFHYTFYRFELEKKKKKQNRLLEFFRNLFAVVEFDASYESGLV